MTDESEEGILTPAQRKYVKNGSQFIQDNDYSEGYADVLESRIRDRFYQAISDLDLLLQHNQRWMSKTTMPLDKQNPEIQEAIERVRTDLMREFLRDVVRGDNNDIDAYGSMLQHDSLNPPEVDTEASHSAKVIDQAKELQAKFDIQGDLYRDGTSLGPVGSIIERILPSASGSINEETFESYQNRAIQFTLLGESGNPIERFSLGVQNESTNLVMADQTEAGFDWYGEAVMRQETALEMLDPANSTNPSKVRYQKEGVQVFPEDNESREIAWLFCSALLDALSASELAANK